MSEDIRYLYSKCISCGRQWQNIDFGCAAHVYYCPDYESGRKHQAVEMQKMIDDLRDDKARIDNAKYELETKLGMVVHTDTGPTDAEINLAQRRLEELFGKDWLEGKE